MGAKDPENLQQVKRLIAKFLSFDPFQYSDSFLSRRLDVRLRALGMDSYEAYSKRLTSDPAEPSLLAKELTIHTTNFFRDRGMWAVFIEEVIPLLVAVKKKAGQSNIRVWSAGSSTGEEPYSIAIAFFEALGDDLGGFSLEIVGTDLDAATVERAQKAEYEALQFREMPVELQGKYFQRVAPEIYTPIPAVKRLVTFRVGDVFSSKKRAGWDIIFCRNTVIYFDKTSKQRLYLEFYDCLNSCGFFVMGMTEMLLGPASEKFQFFNTRERIFFKE